MQHVNSDVVVSTVGVAKANEKADGVQVPLDFLELDTTLAEQIAQRYVGDNDNEQHNPNPGDGATDSTDDVIDGDGEFGFR